MLPQGKFVVEIRGKRVLHKTFTTAIEAAYAYALHLKVQAQYEVLPQCADGWRAS